jgi:hypothetical protein
VKHFNPSTSHDNFIQTLDHEVSKDVILILRMFHDMFTFERKFNKEREDEIRISFALVAAIHSCFILFSHFKSNDGNTRQEKRVKYPKDGYKDKRKAKVMNVIWDANLDDDNNNSDNKAT